MAKTAVLVPRKNMADHVRRLAPEYNIDLQSVVVVDTATAVDEARRAVEAGAGIVVARGLQAQLIVQNTNIPVVEIRLTGQELGLLAKKAKKQAGGKKPVVAFIGFKNLFSSMDHFEQLYGIVPRVYYATDTEDLQLCVERAIADGAQAVIGGEVVVMTATQAGVPGVFYEASEESLREALFIASKMSYAADLEKQFQAQTRTILDVAPGGVLQTDRDGTITECNHLMENLLQKHALELIGSPVCESVPVLEREMVDGVLSGEQERLAVSVTLRGNQLMLVAAPVMVDGKIDGAVFTFHRQGSAAGETASLRERLLRGHVARAGFEQIERSSKAVKKQIELARSYALSKRCITIYGQAGTEKEIFAQAIHNSSTRRNQPYVSVGCFSGDEQAQYEALFGGEATGADTEKKGALLAANFGTLVLHDIERLSDRCQQELLRAIQTKSISRGGADRSATVDVRIIATSAQELSIAVSEGRFRAELYYALGGLMLEIPALREDPDSIRPLAQSYLQQFSAQYAKYLTFDPEALHALEVYPWPGNLMQLEAFCERLVAGAGKRKMTEGAVNILLAQLYPEIRQDAYGTKAVVLRHPEAVRLGELLEKHHGSRKEVAKELGISVTTLWRKMNKYGIEGH